MFTAVTRIASAGILSLALLFSPSIKLSGQTIAASVASVQSANVQLSTEAQSGLPLTTQARNILVSRHAALVQVFTDAPATARSYALPVATRESLLKANPAYAALVEQDMAVTGQLIARIEDSFKNRTSRKVYSLYTATGATRLSFATAFANLSAMEGHVVTVTGLGFPEIVVADSVRPATRTEAESYAAPVVTTSKVSANAVRTNATPSFSGPGITTTAPPVAIVTGPQSAAVIIVNFASTPADTNGNPASSTPLTLQRPLEPSRTTTAC